METNKVVRFVFYLSLLILIGASALIIIAPTPGNINIGNFINYFVGDIMPWGILVGICFSPVAILVSIASFYSDRRGMKYLIAILVINIPFILLVYFGLRAATLHFPMLG
ncbi:hypothetical protein HY311_01745 [Candidatus Nomurabacteria bacterium]|nr:hypothetical protein [Candidatus Nomurabacteria bacterium]